jgi:uncharacterized membrane protein
MKMNFYKNTSYLLVFGLLFFASCLRNVEEEDITEDPVGEEMETDSCESITFSKNVESIINNTCLNCHSAGGNFPDLSSTAKVISHANIVKNEVASRRMPQGTSLTKTQIDAVVCWVDNGAKDD